MSIIYKIKCKNENIKEFYIGSTINFSKRKGIHKYYCNKGLNLKLYNFINENEGWEGWEMEILQKYANITDRNELNKIEYNFILNLEPSLNKHNPAQYKDKAEYHRQYQRNNKDKTKIWTKRYYEKNRDLVKDKVLKRYYNKKKSINNIDDSNQEE